MLIKDEKPVALAVLVVIGWFMLVHEIGPKIWWPSKLAAKQD